MQKRFFLLLLVAMLNVVAWADAGFVITPYRDGEGHYVNYNEGTTKYFGDAGSKGFTEPEVQIKNGDDDITSRYILTYQIGDYTPVTDATGVKKSTDPTTNSSVESNYGQVSLGKHGSITINISAQRRSSFTAVEAPDVASGSYIIDINELTTTHSIVPAFNAASAEATAAGAGDGELALNTVYNNSKWSAVTSILPKYSVTVGSGMSQMDVTDRFTVTISFAKIGDGTQRITLSDDKTKLSFAEFSGATIDGAKTGILTYTFTPNAEYDGIYASATKNIYIKLNEVSSPLPEESKYELQATLDASSFFQENVDTYEGLPRINVYKYGLNDAGTGAHDSYSSPVPTLSYNGTVYPQNSQRGGGEWGDFRMIYKVVEDNSYADDCQYIPFNTSTDNIKPAGQATGLTISADGFQVGGKIGAGYAPGLIKVKGYAVLEESEWIGMTQKALFKEIGKVNDAGVEGSGYPYYATVEFYINVMKRKPEVMISPNPKGLVFGVGDKIEMNSRFDIYGYHSGDDSNGIEGVIVFDPNAKDENGTKKWEKYGNEVDKLSYSFFISRTQQNTKIAISDWPLAAGERNAENEAAWEAAGGDQYSYIWTYPTTHRASENVAIAVHDKIKVGDELVEVTASNLASLSAGHPYLDKGDEESGIMYNSMLGWGNESWTMTFLAAGEYDIPYLLHQYNHVRWDSSDIKIFHYDVRTDIAAELRLSYYYTVAKAGDGENFTEPDATVVLPNLNDHDVTEDFDITYSMDGVTAAEGTFTYKGETGWTKYVDATTGTILYTKTNREEVVIGTAGTVTITAHATKKSTVDVNYNTPANKSYVIKIVDAGSMAQWEIISKTGRDCDEHSDPDEVKYSNMNDAYGRMHFLPMTDYDDSTPETRRNAGLFYGGTVITGVPGIEMTVGATPASAEAATADWLAIVPSAADLASTKKCCEHENATVVVKPTLAVEFDDNSGLPTAGAFYKFEPKVNGFLTIDAKLSLGQRVVLVSNANEEETVTVTSDWSANPGDYGYTYADFDAEGSLLSNYTFKKPLIAGKTYYLYDFTNSIDLNLHGFSYQPAFLMGTEDKDHWSEPYTAHSFMNSLSNGVPKLLSTSYSHATFSVVIVDGDNTPTRSVMPTDYLIVGEHNGSLNPLAITIDENGQFLLRVNADVESTLNTGSGLGNDYSDCTKTPYYKISILDIPTYKVVMVTDNMPGIEPGTKVSTTNIKTDITMTFGALGNPNSTKDDFDANTWKFNVSKDTDGEMTATGVRGVADRIGNPTGICDDPDYNQTIDGFLSFYQGDKNPYDENGKGSLQNAIATDADGNELGTNNGIYTYGSGTAYETTSEKYYNTTYRLPARGTFVKFEPRESGTLLVYLVQNGSCDYYEGVNVSDASKEYGYVKWRPLYITDETGKPVDMVNNFDNVSQYLPTGTDLLNAGSFTLGLSRCSKDAFVATGTIEEDNKEDGCTFDWSKFKGSRADRQNLLDAWPEEGERESIIRLDNGGFVLPHKAYVRYTFNVKAGKTYFVFTPGSKIEFGGFSFVPEGFPNNCKYTVSSTAKKSTNTGLDTDEYEYDPTARYQFNATNQEKNWSGTAATTEVTYAAGSLTAADAQTSIADKSELSGSDYQDAVGRDINFTWDTSSTRFTTNKENLVLTINDRRSSELPGGSNEDNTNSSKIKPRTFSNGIWESICLPFSVSEQEMTRVFGEDYVLVTCDGLYKDTEELLFVRHANRYVEAGRPYLLKPTQNGVFSFRNVTIEGNTNVLKWNGTALVSDAGKKVTDTSRFNLDINDNEFVFKGTYMRETVPQGSYFLYSDASHENGLYRYNEDLKIGGYRAYFQKQTANPGASLSTSINVYEIMVVEEDGEVTEVLSVAEDGTINSLPKNAGVYTVNGQKVSDSPLDLKSLPSGLYIINGKKYIK